MLRIVACPYALTLSKRLKAMGQASGRVMIEQITVAVVVTAHEPGVRFGLKVSGSIQAEQTFTLAQDAGGTRLGVTLDLADPDLAEPATFAAAATDRVGVDGLDTRSATGRRRHRRPPTPGRLEAFKATKS